MVCGSDVTQEFREHFLEVSRKATGPIMSQPGQLAEELHILAEVSEGRSHSPYRSVGLRTKESGRRFM